MIDFLRYLTYDLGFVCFLIFLTATTILFGIKCKKKANKLIFFNLSAIPTALLLFELFSSISQSKHDVVYSGTYSDNRAVSGKKEWVGYGPQEDTAFSVSLTRKNNDSLIFNATYGFKNGKRTAPNNNDTSTFSISLLGGSHLFGEGLNDNQTLGFYLNSLSKQSFNISNYAFNGYGAHQALITAEKKINKTFINHQHVVIYYFIPDHINRAAGKSLWDINGPLYKIENNKLIYSGSFDENTIFKQNFITKRLKIIWRNSHLYNSFFASNYTAKDIIRTKEIIKEMKAVLTKKGCRFILLTRESDESTKQKLDKLLFEPLKRFNIESYSIDSIISDLKENKKMYSINGDGHPNKIYNRKLAKFLIPILLTKEND